jgi:enoyl-CoA hydratase/carnithine racemase
VLFNEVVRSEHALDLGLVWKVVSAETLIDEAIALATVAASQDKELVTRTKATILALDTIIGSDQAVDHEIAPQLWSMEQNGFRDLVQRLQTKISSKS